MTDQTPDGAAATERPPLRPDQIVALRAHLADLPALYRFAISTLTSTSGSEGRRASKPGSRTPLNLTVLHLTDERRKPDWNDRDPRRQNIIDRYGVAPALESWTRLIRDEMIDAGIDWPDMADQATVDTESRWLLDTLDFTLAHDWVHELADDIHHLTRQLQAAAGERPEYRPRCRAIGCGHKLDPMDNGTWYSCPDCGRQYTIAADLQALGQVQPAMTGREAADALGIPWPTIRSWVQRGLLADQGRDRRGRRIYELDAVRRVAKRIRAH